MAFPKKSDVDANYVKLMKMMLPSGIYHGIATHDPAMIQATKDFVREQNIKRDQFEFQMLYGIRTDLQEKLVREGFRLRVYIPYGVDWFPYFMRRLAERPANVAFFCAICCLDRPATPRLSCRGYTSRKFLAGWRPVRVPNLQEFENTSRPN